MILKDNILIFGASGMAGHVIYKYLSDLGEYSISTVSYRKKIDKNTILMDIRNFNEVSKIIQKIKPKYVINAIGVLIQGSQSSNSNAILINSYFPHFLQQHCKSIGAKLIHISTDCVFSGNSIGNYTEDSFRDGDDIYARSKSLGEIINNKDVTIRTSIIGPEIKEDGEGLFHWFMKQKGEINGYANAYWSGVTTLLLAKAIHKVIINNTKGLFHLTNNQKISKYELLVLFKTIWDKQEIKINKVENKHKDKSFLNTKHPEFVVDSTFEEMLLSQKEFMETNNTLFNYTENYSDLFK